MPKSRPQLPTRVVAPGNGVSVRTRLRLDSDERVLLEAIGAHLTRARNSDLAAARRGEKANHRYKALVEQFGIHSRYAGTICLDNDAATKAAKEHLRRHLAGLRRAVATLEHRISAPTRSSCGCGERRGCSSCRGGYATANERWQKLRRLDARRAELARVETRLAAKDYPVVYGGRRLAGTRHHLGKAGLTETQWRRAWSEARHWFGCAGNAGKSGGNPCLTLTRGDGGRWHLTVSVPKPIAEQFGTSTRVQLRHPIALHHRSRELEERLNARSAVRVDLQPDTDTKGRARTYLRLSWVRPAPEAVDLAAARAGGVVGVDLNADHLAATHVDGSGNPVGRPVRIPLDLADASTRTRDGRLRAAVTAVLEHAKTTGATAVAVEDLDFTDSKTREKFGRRRTFRHLIAGFPTAQFKDRVVAMAATQGLAVIAVDPRYTSRYGGASWQRALSTPTVVATRHEGASVAIGRRALGHGLTTRAGRKTGPGKPRQRPVPHQCDGSDARPSAGQERATTDTTEATIRTGAHTPPVHTRQPSRHPPQASGVATPGGLTEQVHAGHRFPGSPHTG
ncbi:IS605 OrfB family transposase [Nocardioides ginsengisegetis]|uniref:IS605 OrfB family transposase n=1 Tax=Nocardioides ginsengisegetis TaxID=661491 RepID=A0A7W3J0A1_9ACTN|nr:transposase [Nocardioides ginsengisegetis]MBA8803948.1 IS605 OrfB family transposase [Nocardioides ginsengisegetis]